MGWLPWLISGATRAARDSTTANGASPRSVARCARARPPAWAAKARAISRPSTRCASTLSQVSTGTRVIAVTAAACSGGPASLA